MTAIFRLLQGGVSILFLNAAEHTQRLHVPHIHSYVRLVSLFVYLALGRGVLSE